MTTINKENYKPAKLSDTKKTLHPYKQRRNYSDTKNKETKWGEPTSSQVNSKQTHKKHCENKSEIKMTVHFTLFLSQRNIDKHVVRTKSLAKTQYRIDKRELTVKPEIVSLSLSQRQAGVAVVALSFSLCPSLSLCGLFVQRV